MGAEFWEYTANFEADTPSLASVLEKHKSRILSLTGDWDDIKLANDLVPDLFTVAPVPDNAKDDFLESIERGTGYYDLNIHGKQLISVRFFGYSCDSPTMSNAVNQTITASASDTTSPPRLRLFKSQNPSDCFIHQSVGLSLTLDVEGSLRQGVSLNIVGKAVKNGHLTLDPKAHVVWKFVKENGADYHHFAQTKIKELDDAWSASLKDSDLDDLRAKESLRLTIALNGIEAYKAGLATLRWVVTPTENPAGKLDHAVSFNVED